MWNNILILLAISATALGAGEWEFVQNGTSGILALEAIVVSPTLILMFDRPSNDPLSINGHPAWGALWNLETNTASPINVLTDSFCASGGILSNGTMVSVGGNPVENLNFVPDISGLAAIRIFEPCTDPAGINCTLFEDPATIHLEESRWYPSSLRIFDGSLMIVGGTHTNTSFFDDNPVLTFEFFPPKDNGIPRPSAFLARSGRANLFPRVFALPDGKVFMAANNQTIIYDIETEEETILPDIPNGVRVTNPFDGTATLLPLSPPDFIPEVLICGGTNSSDEVDPLTLSANDPASTQCSRMTITPEGIAKGWEIEHLLEPRTMPEMILLPNGQIVITNGAQSGYAALASVGTTIGNSNANNPAFTPSLYTPSAPLGERISNTMMPTTDIARMYHSSVTLTPQGNIFIAGSNPNPIVINDTTFHTEFRVQFLNPPFMSQERPAITGIPQQLDFNSTFTINTTIPVGLDTTNIQVALMDLGFSSHAFHSSSRLVFMEATLSEDAQTLSVTSPPNNRIFPPGPGFVFVTVDDVTSPGERVMVGSGASPPVPDQGFQF